ncbi:MAG TPA: ankyrin repeat domain-containing protein [Chitinophagaceae bacterium]|nr:ankyrin repeat domain-containing protein [Chitinophagaceae bacterium]
MKNAEISDPIFLQAVEAIDAGDISMLEDLINVHPRLVTDPLSRPSGDYFKNPYLLWFVADNPIRVPALPANIVEVTRTLVKSVKLLAGTNTQHQLNYTLALVASGRIPKECGVQLQMIDLLIDEGATPGTAWAALTHGNIDAAKRIIERGGKLNLVTAVGLDDMEATKRLFASAPGDDKLVAVQCAAFFGNASMLHFLINAGAPFNDYTPKSSGFHTHSTPLHQAVYSGSLESVKILVEAGAKLNAADKAFGGTPLGWAMYMQDEESPDEEARKRYKVIEEYLKSVGG